ncbi:MAG: hypothetical protein NTW87_24865 [Planctomycetota bacterium]|nr:hypothetical protein [Planctomycetota bacterium]
MTPRHKKILWAVLIVGVLMGGIQLGWTLRGAPPGMKQLLDALNELKPKPATPGDWKAVGVVRSTARLSGHDTPIMVAGNVRPVMEVEGDTYARQLRVVNTRDATNLQTLVWSHKANKTLVLDWSAAELRADKRGDEEPEHSLEPMDRPAAVKYKGKYFIGKPTECAELSINGPGGNHSVPWPRKTFIGVPYYHDGFRYAASIEEYWPAGQEGKLGLVIFDLEKLQVAGTLDLPDQVGRYKPLLIIDPKTDLLLCFDLDVAWIVCVDLRPARLAAEAAEKKPAAADQTAPATAQPKASPPGKVQP